MIIVHKRASEKLARRFKPEQPKLAMGRGRRRVSGTTCLVLPSFLEEVLESLAGIHRPRGLRGRCFLFNPYPHRKKCAVVAFVLARNSFRNGLAAFETAGGVKVRALTARVQGGGAFGALTGRFYSGCEKRATLGAS